MTRKEWRRYFRLIYEIGHCDHHAGMVLLYGFNEQGRLLTERADQLHRRLMRFHWKYGGAPWWRPIPYEVMRVL